MMLQGKNKMARLRLFKEIPDSVYAELAGWEDITLYHTPQWHRFLARTFHWRISGAAIFDSDCTLRWFLPFVTKRRMGIGKQNVCLPLTHQIGPVSNNYSNRRAINILKSRLPCIEIHDVLPLKELSLFQKSQTITCLDLNKYAGLEALFSSFQKSSIQRKIKKAQKNNITIIRGSTKKHCDVFSSLQSKTRQRQGSPAYPEDFFVNMYRELYPEERFHMFLACMDGKPVAGTIFLHYKTTAIYGYGASDNNRKAWKLGVNQAVMWAAIKDAFQKKMAKVDFGISPPHNPDLLSYKQKWGAISTSLPYSTGFGRTSNKTIDRNSRATKTVSCILQKMPEPLFVKLSPFVMKMVV